MCSKPKVPPPPKEKKPQYLRNPYLDDLAIGAERSGRNSLRIDRTSGATGLPSAIGMLSPVIAQSAPSMSPGVVLPPLRVGPGSLMIR